MTNDIEGKVRRLLEELIDMVNQHCQVEFKEDGAILDTMALSSNESAIFLLEELGLAKEIINGRRYKLLDTKENIDRAILSLTTKATGETSDGYHTFNELYEHRISLFIALMKSYPKLSWRANNHEDGTMFEGWFISGMHLPNGDISYHLPIIKWELLDNTGIATTNKAPKWDGHTPKDVIDRLNNFKALTTKLLDEKEVEKVLEREETEDLEPPYRCLPPIDKKMIEIKAKLICSHFSKQIKYPEKKRPLDFPSAMTIEGQMGQMNGYNQALQDMRKLNGEGGV